jgi:hypothetical protein
MPFHNAIFGRRSISVGRIGRALVMAMPKFGTAEGKRPVFGGGFHWANFHGRKTSRNSLKLLHRSGYGLAILQ